MMTNTKQLKVMFEVLINGIKVKLIADSGAPISMIDILQANSLQAVILPFISALNWSGAGGMKLNVVGITVLKANLMGNMFTIVALAVEARIPTILMGINCLQNNKMHLFVGGPSCYLSIR